MDEYAKEFDGKIIIFVCDSNRKSGYIPFKFDLTKEYIKQFLLSFSPPHFNKFVPESIKDKIKTGSTSSVIGTRGKYLKAQNAVAAFTYHENIYIPYNVQTLSIFITTDLYLRANKSFVRDLSEIAYSQLTVEMIKELRKELNNNDKDLSKLYSFKNKSSRSLGFRFKKEDFILPTAFPWINKVLLFDINAPKNLKTLFESTRTILEKVDKAPVPDNIKASLSNQMEKIKNASINIKSLTVAYENFFLYDNENMIIETYVSELNKNISIYDLVAFLGKIIKKDNKFHLIWPKHKLKFNVKKGTYKNKIELKLGKVHTKTSFSTPRDNVLNFGIICTHKNKTIGEKGAMLHKIPDTAHILGLQNFND